MRVALAGVPENATAWQLYSAADIALALLVAIPGTSRVVRSLARSGPGETVAIASLSLAIAGAALTLLPRRM